MLGVDLSLPWVLAGVQPCASLLSEVTEYVAQILSEFGIKGYTSGVTEGDPGSRKAALEAFAGFRRTVYDLAKSAKANPSEPKDALVKNLMQAADRCPPCPATAPSCHCALLANGQ